MKIAIKNLRTSKIEHEWQVRVDRQSVLGNPFYMQNESFRDDVCNKYQAYFEKKIANNNTVFLNELYRLANIAIKYGKLELFCWCAPRRCHAETIKTFLENFITEDEVYHKPCSQDWID